MEASRRLALPRLLQRLTILDSSEALNKSPKLAEVATALAEAVAKAVAKAVAEVGGHSSEALAEGLAEVVAEVKAEALAALAELGCTLIHPPLSRSHALP